MYKEEDLMKAFEKARKGSKDYYEDFCTMMFDEVRRLVSMVYEKESNINKLVNHIFNKLRPRLNEFDSQKEDIHRWVSVFASGMIYSVYNMSNSDVFTYREENSDFEIGYIEEDDEFAECAIHFNRVMSSKNFKKSESAFSMLTKGQIILYQLFCYAGCTVEEIEDMLEVDGIYISSELCDIKQLLVKELKEDLWVSRSAAEKSQSTARVSNEVPEVKTAVTEKVYEDDDSYDDSDDDSDDESDRQDTYTTMPGSTSKDDYESDDEQEDDEPDDDDEPESKYAAYLNGQNERRKAAKGNATRKPKSKKSSGLMGLFDAVPDKMMKLIAMIIIALILVVILAMVLILGNGKNNNNHTNTNNNNVNKEQQTFTQSGEKETKGESQSVNNNQESSAATSENNSESQTQTSDSQTQAPENQEQQTQAPSEETKAPETETQTQAPSEETKAPETETSSSEIPTESQTETKSEESNEQQSSEAEQQSSEQQTETGTEAGGETEAGSSEQSASESAA